jgi:hypothetical protein
MESRWDLGWLAGDKQDLAGVSLETLKALFISVIDMHMLSVRE